MEYTYITKLDMGQLKELRTNLVAQLRLVNERIQGQCYSECSICEKPELAYQSIPEGWSWVISLPGYILCDVHTKRWIEKYGRKSLYIEGDELSEE